MDPALIAIVGIVPAVLLLALALALRRPGAGRRIGHRSASGESELHRRRAESMAEVEARDIDQMIEAINERRRRGGRREIGEELADELRRGTWET